MRIRTQFFVTLVLFAVILGIISASVIFTNYRVAIVGEQENIAWSIAQGAGQLSYLANDYIIYREPQQLERWQNKFASFSHDVASLKEQNPEQEMLVRNIRTNTDNLEEVFNSIISAMANPSQEQDESAYISLLQVSWSRITVQSQALVSDAYQLSHLLDAQEAQARRTNAIAIISLIGIFIAYFIVNYLITQRRVIKGISELQEGTAIIGSGNLDFLIKEKSNDEISDLSRAFNRMTYDLKAITASKADLEKEINERKKIEEALKRSESQLRTLIDNVESGVALIDENGRFTVVNHAFLKMFGLSDKSSIKNVNDQTWSDWQVFREDGKLLTVDDHPVRKAAITGKPVKNELVAVKLPSGDGLTWMLITAEPILKLDGSIALIICTYHDVSERKKVEDMKDEFIGLVSHELRTPMTIISGSLRTVISEGISAEDRETLLQNAIDGADSLSAILENLLELSRYQAGRLQIHREAVDISMVAQNVIEKLKSRSEGHSFLMDFPEDLLLVEADPVRVERILYNLLENAIKYSPEENAIKVFSFMENDMVITGVSDEGIGISPEERNRIFQLFERLEKTSSSKGLGLGLVVCKRLVEAQDGRIWVESEPGKGSTFFFSLPVYKKKASGQDQ